MKLLKPRRSFTQLIKAARTYTASWDDGGWGIENNTSVLSSGWGGGAAVARWSGAAVFLIPSLQVQSQVALRRDIRCKRVAKSFMHLAVAQRAAKTTTCVLSFGHSVGCFMCSLLLNQHSQAASFLLCFFFCLVSLGTEL